MILLSISFQIDNTLKELFSFLWKNKLCKYLHLSLWNKKLIVKIDVMKKLKNISSKLNVIKELFSFLWKNKLWWMMPIIIIFILLGLFIWLAQSSAVVPFIYALF